MKKNLLLLTLSLVAMLFVSEAFAQVGIGTNEPHRSSALDIVSTQRGLLIPRLDIADLQMAAPVNNPAHSLLVFNTGSGGATPQGFYWWDVNASGNDPNFAGAWRPVTAEVTPGDDPIELIGMGYINTFQNANGDWEISFQGGQDGDVLVTNALGEPEWVPLADFLEDVNIVGENGIDVFQDAVTGDWIVKLGGVLTDALTTIETDGDNAALAITNLTDLTATYQDILDNNEDLFVVVMGDDGILKKIHIDEFLEEVQVDVDLNFLNGLKQEGDDVKLGGDLIEPTTIYTGTSALDANNQDPANTLAIAGLAEASAKHVVAVDGGGVLRTARKSVSFDLPASGNVGDGADYSVYTLEVFVEVDIANLSGGDVDLNLPDASAVEGQVISVKLSDGLEASNYLNIKDGANTIAYGALPYQTWTLKSNGTNWRVVSQ